MPKNTKPPMSHARMVATGKFRHKSITKSPVALAWEIFSRNKHLPRKDAMNVALKAGIAFYTVRTQYQAWKKAGDNDKAAAQRSHDMMKRMGLKEGK